MNKTASEINAEEQQRYIDIYVTLRESHNLLRHYAKYLNIYDGGQRVIPDHLDDWILKVTNPQAYAELVKQFDKDMEQNLTTTYDPQRITRTK